MAAAPDGHGYWQVASDGGVFTFGSAVFHGRRGQIPLAAPVAGMAVNQSTGGYWLAVGRRGLRLRRPLPRRRLIQPPTVVGDDRGPYVHPGPGFARSLLLGQVGDGGSSTCPGGKTSTHPGSLYLPGKAESGDSGGSRPGSAA